MALKTNLNTKQTTPSELWTKLKPIAELPTVPTAKKSKRNWLDLFKGEEKK